MRALSFFVLLSACLSAAHPPARAADAARRGWEGEAALGGSLATGNTSRKALDVDAKASHRVGRFEDKYKLSAALAREDGNTTAQRVAAGTQSNVDIRKDLYVLGFAEVDVDRFSGFDYAIDTGVGVGYRIFDTDELSFAVEGGVGYNITREKTTGDKDGNFLFRTSVVAEYALSDNATLANSLMATYDTKRTKVENTFSVTSTLIGNLAARLSVNLRHNTDPPAGIKKTDTLTKAALVYSF